MSKELHSTRTCSVCGLKKPMFAFLEMSGDRSHTYGDICATCRGAGRTRKKNAELEAAEKSGGTTRAQIDNKMRVKDELDKKELRKQTAEDNYEEKIKKENTETEKKTDIKDQEDIERKDRESLKTLEKQDQIAAKTKPGEIKGARENKVSQTQSFYQEKNRVATEFFTDSKSQELGKKTSGLSPEYIAKHVSSTGRSAESLFGNLLGQFLRNNIRSKDTKQITKNANESKAAQTVDAGKNAPEAPAADNVAAEFVRSNMMKK